MKLTDDQVKKLVLLRESSNLKWPNIGKEFEISGEDARRAYRKATGTSASGYTAQAGERTEEKTNYEQGDDFINIVCASRRLLTKDDVIREFKIDLSEWEIERFRVKTSEGYRKDRSVEWHVSEGKVLTGDVSDSGKMLVVPLYHVEVRLKRRIEEARAKNIIQEMVDEAKKYAPVYPKISYPENPEGFLYEIDMMDIHFGRLTWAEESGESYDVKLARAAIESVLLKLLGYVKNQPVERILLPIGNDFFNVDSKLNTTTKGTPQQEDTRWQKTFKLGADICIWMINACLQIAPVDVLIIPGNHDEQRSFYLGTALEFWYHSVENVTVNNQAIHRKYYPFGNNLIGFTHGADEKLPDLPLQMAIDVPKLWAASTYREWHTGDKHHLKKLIPKADESSGMVVRILRSLAALDAWTFNSGYRSLRASEGFLWHPNNGLVAQFTATPDLE